MELPPLAPLPAGIATRLIPGVNGLTMHVLEAGTPGRPVLLLLHGFPELAYSWRKVMPALAEAGYHVIAPDQRGYGRTTGAIAEFDTSLRPFGMLNLVRDAMGLLHALGIARVTAVVGHDFGSPVAAWCALARPDVFPAVALMSAPFAGPPGLAPRGVDPVHAALAALPRPRKHYQWYYSEPGANADMWQAPQGVQAFLRAYYHMKSADWPNAPEPLPGWNAEALARMPTYYIMDHGVGMAATVAPEMPTPAQIAANTWLPDPEMAVYAAEYGRTGFQAGLNWYRARTTPGETAEQEVFAGRRIEVPAAFIAGRSDWGIYQIPGAIERMRVACPRMGEPVLIPGAGHWVQQEQPEAVVAALLAFLGN